MFSLKGKTAVVTGSERGIGKGIATVFAKAGANLVITCPHKGDSEEAAKEMEKLGAKALAVACDVSKEEDVERLVAETVKKFGRLDIFVNNAGVLLQRGVDEVSGKEWDWLMGVNLKGAHHGVKYAAKQMKKQKTGGAILNIASTAALEGYPMLTTYCASKGGILAFTRAAAMELAPSRIRVNAICPGLVETPMTKDFLQTKEAREAQLKDIPIGIIGQPEDIAYGALYLVSDEARYVTGVALVIDGGTTAG